MSDTASAYDLDSLVDEGLKTEIGLKNMSYYTKVANNILPLRNIFTKYYDFIDSIAVTVELTDAELVKYRYKPKYLSRTLYGVDDYWYLIQYMNRCSSEIQFNKKILRLIPSDKIILLNKIVILETDNLEKNHVEMFKDE